MLKGTDEKIIGKELFIEWQTEIAMLPIGTTIGGFSLDDSTFSANGTRLSDKVVRGFECFLFIGLTFGFLGFYILFGGK